MNDQTKHCVAARCATVRSERRGTGALLIVSFLAALVLAGCDKPPPEAQLTAAGEALGEATTELADLDTRIEQT